MGDNVGGSHPQPNPFTTVCHFFNLTGLTGKEEWANLELTYFFLKFPQNYFKSVHSTSFLEKKFSVALNGLSDDGTVNDALIPAT